MQQQSPAQIRKKTTSYQNVTALKILLNSIALLPKTQPEIVEITGLANSTVSRWINFLHTSTKEVKNLVYIADWKRTGERGCWAACWSLGYGMADKPKPKPMTMSEYNKRWRAKKARQPEIFETEKGFKHESR